MHLVYLLIRRSNILGWVDGMHYVQTKGSFFSLALEPGFALLTVHIHFVCFLLDAGTQLPSSNSTSTWDRSTSRSNTHHQ